MKTCINCGAELEENALICTACGTKTEPTEKVKTEEPAAKAVAEEVPVVREAPKTHTPPPPPPGYNPDPKPAPTSRYHPVSAWRFLGIMLLQCIPFFGFIITIVWACGGCHRVNTRNYAQGMLLFYLVNILLIILAWIVMAIITFATGAALFPLIQDIFYEIIYAIA